jgi:hypothetical protein
MSFVNSIQKTLSDKLSEIDGLKYYTDLEYEKSHYANMTFPELGNINLFSIVDRPPKNSSPQTKKEIEYVYIEKNNQIDTFGISSILNSFQRILSKSNPK